MKNQYEDFRGMNAWEIATAWYKEEDVRRGITETKPFQNGSECVAWMTEQYRLAMRKGIEIGVELARMDHEDERNQSGA